jgi:hypothetical protein
MLNTVVRTLPALPPNAVFPGTIFHSCSRFLQVINQALSRQDMDTPQRLPPHAAMTLPNPDKGLTAIGRPVGQLPAPPQPKWHVGDESMRTWLQAKCEEDKRRQQEERTRQEELRLDRRKIEQSMLRESTEGGVPPHMIPLIFAGVAERNLPAASLEWAQVRKAKLERKGISTINRQVLQVREKGSVQ